MEFTSLLCSRGAFSKVRGRARDERVYKIDRNRRRRQQRVPGALLGDESQWRKVNSLLRRRRRRVPRLRCQILRVAAHVKANRANENSH